MPAPAVTPAAPATPAHPLDGWPSERTLPMERARTLALRFWPYAAIIVAAVAARLRYIAGYHDNFGSGDAHLVALKAWFIERGELTPPASVGIGANIFSDPPLIPLLLAAVAKATPLSVTNAPLLVTPVISIVGLLALYAVLERATDRPIAVVASVLVAVLPRYAFDSSEPDKVAYVVSFFLVSLFFLYAGQRKRSLLLLSGLFAGLACFSHTTGWFFLPVLVLSHLALAMPHLGRAFDRYALAAAAIPIVFIAAYVTLDDHYRAAAPPASTGIPTPLPGAGEGIPIDGPAPAGSDGTRFLPERVERYWENFRGLFGEGFRGSAWDQYLDGIRDQVLDPVFALAVAGVAIALGLIALRGQYRLAPLVLWMVLVAAGFALQEPAASHATRYPSYVTPVFVVFATCAVFWIARAVVARFELEPAYALALVAPVLAWVAFSYVTAPEQGLRHLYEGQQQLARHAAEERLVTSESRILYLGWPSYTLYLLDGGVSPLDVRAFGWQQYDLSRFDAAFLDENNIKYYALDDTNEDYYGNGHKMLNQLSQSVDFEEAGVFCSNPGRENDVQTCSGYTRLFALVPKAQP